MELLILNPVSLQPPGTVANPLFYFFLLLLQFHFSSVITQNQAKCLVCVGFHNTTSISIASDAHLICLAFALQTVHLLS
jgi:hypothetical protein